MLCSEWALVKRLRRAISVSPLKCKTWTCPLCGPMRARQLAREAHLGQPTTFLTLTVNPAIGIDADDRAVSLSHAWRTLRKRIIRRYGIKALPFLAVFEKTKRGEPHLHILARMPYVPQAWLSDQMKELTGAPVVDIRSINDPRKAANYVTKYIAKDPHKFVGTKRYWQSRDYQLADPEADEDDGRPKPTFTVARMSVLSYVASAVLSGFLFDGPHQETYHLNYDWYRSQGSPRGPPGAR